MTPKTVAAHMIETSEANLEHLARRLREEQDRCRALRLEISDVPSKWVGVLEVALSDERYYFVQRTVNRRRLGDVCLARWTEQRGWQEIIGHIIPSTAQNSNLIVLVPK